MDLTLTAETGRTAGSRSSSRLRAEGRVPGVVYGLGRDAVAITLPWPELRRALSTEAGTNALITLDVDGERDLAIVKDLQRHPVRRNVLHIDFLRVDPDALVAIDVPIILVGEARQVENRRGVVDHPLKALTVQRQAVRDPVARSRSTSTTSTSVSPSRSPSWSCPPASPPTSIPRAPSSPAWPPASACSSTTASIPPSSTTARARVAARLRRPKPTPPARPTPSRWRSAPGPSGPAGAPPPTGWSSASATPARSTPEAATTSASRSSTCWPAGTARRLKSGKERALVDEVRIDGQRVALAEPTTFMNLSGESVSPLVRRFGIEDPTRLVIVQDELDLPVGRVRVKVGGGLAGHNGLRSIKAHLHTDAFVRVRIGVGKPPSKEHGADHVLKKVTKSDRELLAVAVEEAADAVELIVADGTDAAMNQVNTRPT